MENIVGYLVPGQRDWNREAENADKKGFRLMVVEVPKEDLSVILIHEMIMPED